MNADKINMEDKVKDLEVKVKVVKNKNKVVKELSPGRAAKLKRQREKLANN